MEKLIPEKLKKGDEIRVIAPSRSMTILGKDCIELATKRLEDEGFKVTFAEHVMDSFDDDYNCAKIEDRVKDLEDAFKDKNVKAILTVIGIIGFAICGSLLDIYKTFTILRYPLLTLSGIIGISSFVIYLLTPNIEYKGTVTFDEKTLTDDRAIIENIAYPASNVYYKKVVKQNCFVYQAEDEIFLINQDEITGEHPELLAPAVNQKTAKNLKLTMIICVIVFVLSLKSFYKMMKFVNNKFSLWASKLTFKRKKTYIKEEVNSSGGLGSFVHE